MNGFWWTMGGMAWGCVAMNGALWIASEKMQWDTLSLSGFLKTAVLGLGAAAAPFLILMAAMAVF